MHKLSKYTTLETILVWQAESLARAVSMKQSRNPLLNKELDRLRILTLRSADAIAAEARIERRRNQEAEA
jgi:hypothetical protein